MNVAVRNFYEDAPDYDSWGDIPECVDADPEAFFPDLASAAGGNPIKALCERCPVKAPCLEYALSLPATDDYGVWGGTTPRERIVLRRRLNVPRGRRTNHDHKPCGTGAAKRRHQRAGEWPCPRCVDAGLVRQTDVIAERRGAA